MSNPKTMESGRYTMRNPASLLLVVLTMFGAHALGSSVRIIANPSVKAETISSSEIRSVFLEERSSLRDGTHVEPVLSKVGTVHAEFLERYVGLSGNDLRAYYRALVFTGRGSMPKELGTDADVVAYVARTRGAIGYVSAESSAEGVKSLTIEDAGGSAERKLILRVEPDYPETLKQLKIGGTVRLRVAISPRGTVETVKLLGGNPILGEAAEVAVKKWMYAPGKAQTVTEVRLQFDGK